MTPPRSPVLRAALAALTVSALAFLACGALLAWRETAFQDWTAQGLGWLGLEAWSRERPWLSAGIAGACAFGLAFLPGRDRSARTPSGNAGGPRSRMGAVRALTGLAARPPLAALALLSACGLPRLVAGSARPVAPARAPNVLFVLIDTWRADHAGFLGYERAVSPELDRLSERGVVFERAISQAPWTKPAVATLFTGLLPSRHHAVSQPLPDVPVRATRLQPPVTTFIEILHGKGWQTAMWSDNPNITPPRGFDQGAESFRDYFHEPDAEHEDCGALPEILGDVRRWLAEERDPERPFCLYVHVMDPHYPYEPPGPFRGQFDRSGCEVQLTGPVVREYLCGERDVADLTPARLTSLVDRYDEELLAVDHELGPFLEQVLREDPDTVVVLSGDHGEEFLEHGGLGHSHALWEELVHVPLVLWGPDLAPARISAQVRLMDVAPTLLELVGLSRSIPSVTQGQSLVPVIAGRETGDRPAPLETGGDQKPCWHWRGISDGRMKLIRRERDLPTRETIPALSPEDARERPYWRLFDLESDPAELANLCPERRAEAEALFAEMQRRGWYVPPEELLGQRALTPSISAHEAHELEALGYGGVSQEGRSP